MNKKVTIIGGGIAGLSAGIYGQLNGYDTQIIEMNTVPGGQCTAWARNGYHFDYCLHWLVGTSKGAFNDIWKETGVLNEDTKIIDHEIHTKISNENGNEFIIYTNIDKWEKYLLNLAPEDAKGIKKMCNDMRKGTSLEPFSNPPELRKTSDYISALKKMMPAIIMMMKYGKKSCKEYFEKLNIKNLNISMVFNTLYGDKDFSALAFLMMLTWMNQKNAGYIIGGSLPLIMRMCEKYRSLGGNLLLGKKAKKIIVENNKAVGIILDDDTTITSDYVISAADGHYTIYDMLEGKYISDEVKEAYESWNLFNPLVQASFGINKEIKSDFPNQSFITKEGHIGSTKLDPGYSIMNYSFDPTIAPAGKTVITLRFDSPWDIWENMKDETYILEKEQIKSDATYFLEKHFPGITEHIEVIDIATPLTDVRYTGVWKGSYEGFMPSSKNITKNLKMTLPNLNNFFMIGQWLFPGGGLPPSAQSGKWVFQLICKKENKIFKSK